jgi:hypothetical protein
MTEIKHISESELLKEFDQAIKFDLRDNPQTKALYDEYQKEGIVGEKKFMKLLQDDLVAEFKESRERVLFPWTRAAVKSRVDGEGTHHQFGLGFISAIAPLISTAVSAGAEIYKTRETLKAQKDIQELQAAAELRKVQAAEEAAKAEQAKAAAIIASQQQQGGTGGTILGMSPVTLGLLGVGAVVLIFVVPKILPR